MPNVVPRLLSALIGDLCALCREPVAGREARLQLCRYCLADLPWQLRDERPGEGPIARLVAPLRYQGEVQHWVLAAKRETGLVAAALLGHLLAEVLSDVYPPGERRPELLIPVPLAWRRLLRRGHNQAQLIGAPVARRQRIPLARNAVRRIRHTPIQPSQTRQTRAANVQRAFATRRRFDDLTVAIVDDLVTTGATSTALAEALREAGAREVHLWCPAHA